MASDAVSCKVCLRLVGTNSIQCDCCLAWCHSSCVNLSITALARISKSHVVWNCPPCRQMEVMTSLQSTVTQQIEVVASLQRSSQRQIEAVASLQSTVHMQSLELAHMDTKYDRLTKEINLKSSATAELSDKVCILQDSLASAFCTIKAL